jgi:hypothetical protein
MEFQIKYELNKEETEKLASLLDCATATLPEHVAKFGKSAIQEYIEMFMGRKAFKQGSDFREYRLYLMIGSIFNDTIPDDQQVTDLFQTTPSESKTLIRSVLAKYHIQLKPVIRTTLLDLLMHANQIAPPNGIYYMVIKSQNLVDEMNQILTEIDGTLTPVTKARSKVSTYEVWPKSREELLSYLR